MLNINCPSSVPIVSWLVTHVLSLLTHRKLAKIKHFGILRRLYTHTHLSKFLLFCLHTVQSQTAVTGFLGTNITLKFTFPADVSIQNNSHFVVHQNSKQQKKVAEYTQGNRGDVFEVHPENNSVLWHITGVRLNDSGDYWASLVNIGVIKSNTVWVNIREAATNCTGKQILLY